MKIKFGQRELSFPGKEMDELRSSNGIQHDMEASRKRLTKDGYLLFREFLEPEDVIAAREKILEYISQNRALQPGTPVLEGIMPDGRKNVNMMGSKGIVSDPAVLRVLENPRLFTFFNELFSDKSDTYNYKWLRAVGNEEFTGAHYDTVYMGRGSKKLHTVWVPFGQIPPESGTLAICAGSNHLPQFEKLRQTYGKLDVDNDLVEGWFSRDPMEIAEKFGGQWLTTTFHPGDVIIFGMLTMHASTTNLTNRYRLSCDIRFQPQNEDYDDRWVGKNPVGHSGFVLKPLKSMEEARAGWGL